MPKQVTVQSMMILCPLPNKHVTHVLIKISNWYIVARMMLYMSISSFSKTWCGKDNYKILTTSC